MVKRRATMTPEHWLAHFQRQRSGESLPLLQKAIEMYGAATLPLLEKGLGLAEILLELGLDNEGLAAAIIYPGLQAQEIHIDTVIDHFGESSARLLRDVLQMGALGKLQHVEQRASHQLENLRKMLLAMVADVRAVLMVLAERLWLLRHSKMLPKSEQQRLGQETLNVYAPLANRLGVGQLKWEMEDLCLRQLKPDIYKEIASWLASRREEREQYVQRVIGLLQALLQNAGIRDFQVTGRVKHIYSIYRKMQRKGGDLNEIYDISAVRVIVAEITDCYAALGVVHGAWQQIPKEFDDYVTNPKPNGYRSIHTAVIGPEGHTVEVQVRTLQMHQESELGVAAHWRYKEGGVQKSSYEAKIAWLRQVMEWQKEVATNEQKKKDEDNAPAADLFADRVYVFTPTGDIVDLPQGATPLDFAYHIHSEVGHRCRGAKVNGNIVSLTYQLQMGERIEILTAKQAGPSRDWLSPHLGYLKTPRARAKVQHWFKMQDYMQHITAGRALVDKELKRLGLNALPDLNAIAQQLHYKTSDDVLAALGAGDIRLAQLLHHIQPAAALELPMPLRPATSVSKSKPAAGDIQILGVGNLLTQMARCCKPLPGEPIIGYITQGKGVSIHRQDCSNILHVAEENRQRLIEVEWGEKAAEIYPVDIYIQAYDRPGLLRDMTTLFASEKINVINLQTQVDKSAHEAHFHATIEIDNLLHLQKILDRLQQISNVISAKRQAQ